MLLADWLALDRTEQPLLTSSAKATVFCSSATRRLDMAHFMQRQAAPRLLQMRGIIFDYASNALLTCPAARRWRPAHRLAGMAIDEMRQLVPCQPRRAFCSSPANAEGTVPSPHWAAPCRPRADRAGAGTPKLELVRRFRSDGNAVLFATKSFFEGVSIDGAALRPVVVDKMPFEALHAMTQAMEADMLDKARAAGISGKTLRCTRSTTCECRA